MGQDEHQEKQRYHAIKRVTLMTAIINAVLAFLKMVVGFSAHSHALFADGIHSLADLISDMIVMVAVKFGTMTRDQDHPYGHGKIETLGTAVLALILVAVGVGIAIDAIKDILVNEHEIPELIVLGIALLSILANEAVFQITKRIADRNQSNLLLANAWHHRSDALSSVVVLVGASGSIMGWPYLDAVAAVIVAMMIVQMAWTLVWRSLRELIDTAVDDVTLAKIKSLIKQVSGVEQLHECRTRYMRGHILVDVHVIVDSYLSVSEGHHIAQLVRQTLQQNMPNIIDVTVHIDPEDDEIYPPSIELPTRSELIKKITPVLEGYPGFAEMRMTLHYLAGNLQVNFALPVTLLQEFKHADLISMYQQAQHIDADINRVDVSYY